MRNADAGLAPLYVRVLGDCWPRIEEPVRRAHATHSVTRARGHLRLEHGRHFFARVLVRVLRLPRPSAAGDTRLIVRAGDGGEHWQRTIDGCAFNTWQYQSPASDLAERFGPLELRFRLEEHAGSLVFVQREAAFVAGPLRLAIPTWCAPRVEAREYGAGLATVGVRVRVSLPVIGLLIAYDGSIDIEDSAS